MQKTLIKKIIVVLFFLPCFLFSQKANKAQRNLIEDFHHIEHGDLIHYLADTVQLVQQKTCERWLMVDLYPEQVLRRYNKLIAGKHIELNTTIPDFEILVVAGEIVTHRVIFYFDDANLKIDSIFIFKENQAIEDDISPRK